MGLLSIHTHTQTYTRTVWEDEVKYSVKTHRAPGLKCRRQDMCVVLEVLEPSLCFPVPVFNHVCVSVCV